MATVKGGKGKHRGGRAIKGDESTEQVDGYAASYVQKIVKCGKAGCKKCQAPGGGHGPYWYKIYRTVDGKVRTKYYGKVVPKHGETEGEGER